MTRRTPERLRRDFRLLWGGQAISFTGDAAFTVALGWRVTELTGKADSLSATSWRCSRSRCSRRSCSAACSQTGIPDGG
jgi:hypothetical protein